MIYFYRYVLPIANILYARVYVWIVYCLHRIIRRKNVLYTSLVPTLLYLIRLIPITNTHNGQKGIDLIVGKHYTHRKRKHKHFLVGVFRRELT